MYCSLIERIPNRSINPSAAHELSFSKLHRQPLYHDVSQDGVKAQAHRPRTFSLGSLGRSPAFLEPRKIPPGFSSLADVILFTHATVSIIILAVS